MPVSALTRKALRDLWLMRGQALAIALVIAAGIAMLVMSQSTLDSLRTTRDMLYAQQRFAHVWAHLKRAPSAVERQIADLPGVAETETRIVSFAKMEVPGFADPVQALMQSLPDDGQPRLNRVHLRTGRMLAPGAQDEILISDAFAKAHRLKPGDRLRLTVHGRTQWFRLAGIAVSAEHLYQIKHGGMFPDYERYAIVWAPRRAMEAAMDMKGAFNQIVIRLAHAGTASARLQQEQQVIRATDRILQRYGGIGATGRMEQMSFRFLHEELKQLATNVWLFPAIFLGVAAFLLNVVFKRLIGMQRDQVATLKAFGYGTWQVALHYGQIVTLICLLGAVIGTLAGAWLGTLLAGQYQKNFRFPYLVFSTDAQVVAIGAAISLLAALAGTGHAVFAAASEPVAQAMRPPAPESFRPTLIERLGLTRWLSQPTRMILRQLERRPFKALMTVIGLALAGGIVMMSDFQIGAINHLLAVEFGLARHYDVAASFTEAAPRRALHELRALPGVRAVEGTRMVSVRIGHLNHQVLTAIEGLPENARMRRPFSAGLQRMQLPPAGLVLGTWLARRLGVQPGDTVWVEVMEGRQPRLTLPVAQLLDESLGMNAYMSLPALNRALGDDDLASSAFLLVDKGMETSVLRELDRRPLVSSAESQAASLRNYRSTISTFTRIFTLMATLMGAIINFGVVYNSARMSLSERTRELASLRVLGFTRGEVSYILLGELALLVLLSLPVAAAVGYALSAFVAHGMSTELFRVPLIVRPSTFAFPSFVTCVSAIISALAVNWRVRRLDLIEALKTRE